MALVHHNHDRALSSFVVALKVSAQRSPAVIGELLEVANKAMAAGETQLDGIRLDGLRVTNDDVEVISYCTVQEKAITAESTPIMYVDCAHA